MGWAHINPDCRESLRRQGTISAEYFLRIPGVILCGHPDRHVLKVDEGKTLSGAILKKEHRVPWRDRLANAWSGFGFVSQSSREAKVLQEAAQAGIPCPAVLAHGAAGQEAFLLLRAASGMTDLRHYAQQHPDQRRNIAWALGKEL